MNTFVYIAFFLVYAIISYTLEARKEKNNKKPARRKTQSPPKASGPTLEDLIGDYERYLKGEKGKAAAEPATAPEPLLKPSHEAEETQPYALPDEAEPPQPAQPAYQPMVPAGTPSLQDMYEQSKKERYAQATKGAEFTSKYGLGAYSRENTAKTIRKRKKKAQTFHFNGRDMILYNVILEPYKFDGELQ